MDNGQANTALRRKLEAGRTSVAASRQVTPAKALSTAFVQACDSRLGLVASVTSCSGRKATLAELLETIPEGGLLAVLEGPGEAQGLVVFDPPLLASVVEKLMTGRISDREPRPRRPTRTDAALSADLIDDVLRAFEAPLLGDPAARWSAGFGYSSFLDDPRPLGLMFEDIDYRVHTLVADLDGGRRSARMVLAVPAEGRGPVGRAEQDTDGGGPPSIPEPPLEEGAPPWADALKAQVMRGCVPVDAILWRISLPISTLERLQPGEELPIPAAAIDETEVLAVDGSLVVLGRLGQSGGRRAVRIAGAGMSDTDHAAEGRSHEPGPAGSGAGTVAALPGPDLPKMDDPLPGRVETHAAPSLPDPPGPADGDAASDDPLSGLPDLPDLPPLEGSGPDAEGGAPPMPDLPDLSKL